MRLRIMKIYFFVMLFLLITSIFSSHNTPIILYTENNSNLLFNDNTIKSIECFTDDCSLKRIETKIDDLTELTESCCDCSIDVSSSLDALIDQNASCCELTGSNLDSLTELIESCCDYTNSLLEVNNSLIDAIETGSGSCCCGTEITASDIGIGGVFSISSPGLYCLTEDVTTTTGIAITISASDVILDLREHTINGSSTTLNAISVTSFDNVVIKNGTIINTALAGITATTVNENLEIDNVNIINSGSFGIIINSCPNVLITNSLIQSSGSDSLFVLSTANNIKVDNLKVIDSTGDGVTFSSCTGVELSNSIIQTSSGENLSCLSVDTASFNNLLIEGSIGGDGILCSSTTNAVFNNCLIRGNTLTGMTVVDSTNININNCQAFGNGTEGFSVSTSTDISTVSNISFLQCTAENNTSSGFSILSPAVGIIPTDNVSNILYKECLSSENGIAGFIINMTGTSLSTGSCNTVSYLQCSSKDNITNGFETLSSPVNDLAISNTLYEECISENNGTLATSHHGFQIRHSNLTINNSFAIGNTSRGILIFSDFVTVNNCIINNNNSHGIEDAGTTDNVFSNCIANYNALAGIRTTSDSTITFCQAVGNGTIGIESTGTGGTKVYGNIASNNPTNFSGGSIPLITAPPGASDGKWINASVT